MTRSSREPTKIVWVLMIVAACRAATPPESSVPAPVPAAAMNQVTSTTSPADTGRAADARFMQGMIAHHAQALAMTGLLKSRTASDRMRLLGQRIDVSQRDEIAMMQRWLKEHGAAVPDPDALHHMMAGHATLMPGMLTQAEMSKLAAASGPEFDRLFLEYMIRHHEGALAMVRDLFARQGAAQETQVFRFAADVDADQRAEIQRMQTLLEQMK